MRKGLFIAIVLVLAGAIPAGAISNGQLDGDAHPNAGELVIRLGDGGVDSCSGSLLSRIAFLTSARCASFAEDMLDQGLEVGVSFEPVVDPFEGRLIPATGAVIPPQFDPSSGFFDYGVVTLGRAVRGVTPIELPKLNALGATKKTTPLVVVGYGVGVDCSGTGLCEPDSLFDVRRSATVAVAGVSQEFISIQMNESAYGTGGICYGDGGAPYYLGSSNTVVAVQDGFAGFGVNRNSCTSIGWASRLDTRTAREFLDDFVALP